ncbi:MAG: Flp pilus assembly protein CpaB [Caulobacter sp.]|nr:Flp pilus assembly protein CpaB [Caulobacter sp.]
MSAVRLFILVIAAIAAIALAFVVRGAFAPKKPETAAAGAAAPAGPTAAPTVKVLVAQRDLPAGTRLTAADMTWQDWPSANLNAAYITDGAAPQVQQTGAAGAAKKAAEAAGNLFGGAAVQSIVGAVVREPLLQGEPVVARKIVRAGEGNFLSVVLTPGMRAMAVPVSVDTAAGGFIMPGDRVDVLLSRDDDDKGLITQTVLRNLRVLAIDQAAEVAKDAKTIVGAVATLEVAAGDAELLADAQAESKKGGSLVLALRAYTDAGAPAGSGGSGPGGPGRTIRVYRAGQSSEVTVSR